jgi:hypothetical protein
MIKINLGFWTCHNFSIVFVDVSKLLVLGHVSFLFIAHFGLHWTSEKICVKTTQVTSHGIILFNPILVGCGTSKQFCVITTQLTSHDMILFTPILVTKIFWFINWVFYRLHDMWNATFLLLLWQLFTNA